MSELDQVLRGDAGPEFLINIDSGAFESQIGIDCYDRHIAVDAFVVSRQKARNKAAVAYRVRVR